MSPLEASDRKPSQVRAGQRWAISAARWATGSQNARTSKRSASAECRCVTGFPRLAKSDDADAKFHGEG